MVPYEIEAAELPRGLPHDIAGKVVVGQIARQADGLATGGRDLPHHGVGGFLA